MSSLKRHDLFITSVWTQKIAGFEDINKNLLRNVFDKNIPLVSSANTYGGSEATLQYDESLREILDIAEELAMDIAKFMGLLNENNRNPRIACFWGNVNKEK